MDLTRFHQVEQTVQLPTLMATECQICKNTLTSCPMAGTTPVRALFSTTAFGGTAPFLSTIGMKKTRCSTINLLAAQLVQTELAASFCATKTLWGTSVQTGLTTTKTALLMLQTQTTTEMQIV